MYFSQSLTKLLLLTRKQGHEKLPTTLKKSYELSDYSDQHVFNIINVVTDFYILLVQALNESYNI